MKSLDTCLVEFVVFFSDIYGGKPRVSGYDWQVQYIDLFFLVFPSWCSGFRDHRGSILQVQVDTLQDVSVFCKFQETVSFILESFFLNVRLETLKCQ